MMLVWYLVGAVFTLFVILGVAVYMEESGKASEEELDSSWVFLLSVFWPILWGLLLLDIGFTILKESIRWVVKQFDKKDKV